MKTAFRIVSILIVITLLVCVYLFKYADNPVKLKGSNGKVVFGYDKNQRKWLINEFQQFTLGVDGPHIFYKSGNVSEHIATQSSGNIVKTQHPASFADSIVCIWDDSTAEPFMFSLKQLKINPAVYPAMPEKLLAISDIEGNMNAFCKLLFTNHVIDNNYNWTFGQGHLVLVGDFMDRGINVTQVLYLVYKLEEEAELAGGKLHFILGNHEQLNLQGTAEYAQPKYLELVRQLGIPYSELYSKNTELGRWLRTKNCIEKIGGYVFVHGGISKEVADMNLPLEMINELCRNNIDKKLKQLTGSNEQTLLGKNGILWYRGMVKEYKETSKQTEAEFNHVAAALQATTIVVGHTIVDDISTDYGGKLIRLDVHHSNDNPEALLIYNGQLTVMDANGKSRNL